jgi:diguanylate cyclase (GGDEF)-like protein
MEDNQPGQANAANFENANDSADTERAAAPRALFVMPEPSAPPAEALKAREVLEKSGYQLEWRTPAEVLAGQVISTPDVVLLDGASPAVGALCQHLKAEQPRAPVGALDSTAPVVVLVSHEVDFVALTQAGADEFLAEDSLEVEIEARFATAVRLAYLKRDLLATQERLSHQIQVDDLTQVLNRRFFFQAAYRECSRARRYHHALSCLMVDVDHFHLYNTSFGYSCGDYILKEVAKMLNACVRDTDLVARFGGSKFVILLTHTDVEGASTVRHKMESLISGNYFVWHHQRLPVTVSIGESERVPGRTQTLGSNDEEEDTHPLSTREDLAELLEDADSALFVAKKGARYPSFIESNVSMSDARSSS